MTQIVPDETAFLKLSRMTMPFGKYQGLRLVDLPEPYLVWFSRKGYPPGPLGTALREVYEIKLNGLEYLFRQASPKLEESAQRRVKLYTAQYRYQGPDRLDVTVKGKDPLGKWFAPTWKLVMASRQGTLAWEEYRRNYRDLMRESFRLHTDVWNQVLSMEEVTLVCFCRAGGQCHRYLLADYFSSLGADVRGERSLVGEER